MVIGWGRCWTVAIHTLSLDLRERILAAYDNNEGSRDPVARRFRIPLGLVKKLLQQRRHTGNIALRHCFSGRKPMMVTTHRSHRRALLTKKNDLTLRESQAAGLKCSPQAIHVVLWKPGLTYKKGTLGQQAGPSRYGPGVAALAQAASEFRPGQTDFLNEAGAKTNFARVCGHAPEGQCVHTRVRYGRWQTTTMMASLRLDGRTECMTLEGAIDTESFRVYVERIPVPTLQPGDLVGNGPAVKSRSSFLIILLFCAVWSVQLDYAHDRQSSSAGIGRIDSAAELQSTPRNSL